MIDYMAEQNHHLKRNYLDDKRPRVPLYPPLEDSDVLGGSHRNPHTGTQQSSLSTSFAELLLEDRSMLHNNRDGRLSRENRVYSDNLLLDNCNDIDSLRDTIIALQLQNKQLNLCLQQEKDRRMECESIIKKDRKYIEKLEEGVKNLKSSRLVIEPNMYRQIAETYMASRKTPVRRTCSSNAHKNNHYDDLVCDSGSENSLPPSPHMMNTWRDRGAAETTDPPNRTSSNNQFNRPVQLRQWSSDSNESNISSDNNFYQPSSSTLPPPPPL